MDRLEFSQVWSLSMPNSRLKYLFGQHNAQRYCCWFLFGFSVVRPPQPMIAVTKWVCVCMGERASGPQRTWIGQRQLSRLRQHQHRPLHVFNQFETQHTVNWIRKKIMLGLRPINIHRVFLLFHLLRRRIPTFRVFVYQIECLLFILTGETSTERRRKPKLK